MRILGLAVLPALLACSDTTGNGGGNGNDLNVAGTWTGTLTFTTPTGPLSGAANLVLTHSGSAIGGTITFDGGEASNVQGTLTGTTLSLVITATQSTSDDCHLFPVTVGFTASASTLTATSASGQICDGDGMGGHEALTTLNGASGTLTR